MRIRKALIISLALTGFLPIYGQDIVWNVVQNNPLGINPGFASNPGHSSSLFVSTRNQWVNLPGAQKYSGAINTNQISFISPISTPWFNGKKNGLGISFQILDRKSGEGRLGYSSFANNIGTYLPLLKSHSRNVACYVGMGYALSQYAIDWSQLTFTSQLDPYIGLVSTTPQVNPRYTSAPSNISVSGQFGGFLHGNITSSTFFKVGYGLFHFGPEIVTFFDQSERVSERHSFHGSITHFPRSRSGLRRDLQTSYWSFLQIFQIQSPIGTSESRLSFCTGGVVLNSFGLRSHYFLALDSKVDSWLYSLQLNTNYGIVAVGYEYTISKLNNGRSGGTIDLGITIPIGTSFGPRSYRKQEHCYVEDLLMTSEWNAAKNRIKSETPWKVSYSPITYIL